jgi:pimeloyl-ACP methyl ester carboxylesterase
MDHRMFEAQVASLAGRYRVLVWDVRGHGQSRTRLGNFSVRSAAEDLLALLNHLGYQQAVLVGHSMGGFISQELLFYYPERVTALVTIGSTCLTLDHPDGRAWLMRLSPKLLNLIPYKLLIWYAARDITVTPEGRAYVEEVLGRHTRSEFITIWAAVMNCLHPESDYRIGQPVLVTHGEQDNLGFGLIPQQATAWAQRDPQCHYVVVPKAGHNAQQENPTFFNKGLLDFLNQCAP